MIMFATYAVTTANSRPAHAVLHVSVTDSYCSRICVGTALISFTIFSLEFPHVAVNCDKLHYNVKNF